MLPYYVLSELDKDVQCSYDVVSQAIAGGTHSHSTIEIVEKNKTRFWNISLRESADAVFYLFAENFISCHMEHRSLGDRGEQWSFFGSDGMVIFFLQEPLASMVFRWFLGYSTITITDFQPPDHCFQWFFDDLGVIQPLISILVFDGHGPLDQ